MDHGQTGAAFGPIGVQALDELQRGASPAGWLETTSSVFFYYYPPKKNLR